VGLPPLSLPLCAKSFELNLIVQYCAFSAENPAKFFVGRSGTFCLIVKLLFHSVTKIICAELRRAPFNMSLESFLSLSLEQQIGQYFYIGLAGTRIDAETRALIEEVQPGGVIIFGRNVENAPQLRKLLDDVREILPTNRSSELIRKAAS